MSLNKAPQQFMELHNFNFNQGHMSLFKNITSNLNQKRDISKRKRINKRDAKVDYCNTALMDVIGKSMDKYAIELIVDLSRSIFEFARDITRNPSLYPELIASGLAWKALKFIYFQLKEDVHTNNDLKVSVREATVMLKNLISFAHEVDNYGAESFAFKNLHNETEKVIIKDFWRCVNAILGKKIQETMLSQFVINNNELVFANFDPRKFLQQFSVKEEASPELVWNHETRQELFSVIEAQIENLPNSFYDKLVQFEYSVNKRELRVEGIFVRHFNTQMDYKPPNMEHFEEKLIEKLKENVEFKYLRDLSQQEC